MDRNVNISDDLLANAIHESCDGIIIADVQKQDFPLVYVNRGFEKLTGYSADEAIGKSYHFLQGSDTDQPEAEAMHSAIARSEACVVTLRNYRKDGSMFWNETSISPVHNADAAPTHFIGIQKDVTARILLEQRLITADPLVGVSNRRHFDQRFADSLIFTRRAHSGMSVLRIELDFFSQYIERYGRSAGDECLRRVGDCLAGLFVRTSDCVARFGEWEFAVVSLSFGAGALRQHAQKLCEQVRLLSIPHSGSPHGVVTISVGGVHCMPNRETTEGILSGLANSKLQAAKRNGCNQALITG
ncbi:MAG TPA: diguanylate cyclase [Gallionella sp.]|nr:diguanylate cyclase [Gallionella sp.]